MTERFDTVGRHRLQFVKGVNDFGELLGKEGLFRWRQLQPRQFGYMLYIFDRDHEKSL